MHASRKQVYWPILSILVFIVDVFIIKLCHVLQISLVIDLIIHHYKSVDIHNFFVFFIGDIMGFTISKKTVFGIGFIVSKAYRKQGIGQKLWQYRWERMASITWGVDAAPRRLVPNQKLGFCEPECQILVNTN